MSQLPRPTSTKSSGISSLSRESSTVSSASISGTRSKLTELRHYGVRKSDIGSTGTSASEDVSLEFELGDKVYVGGTKLGKVAFVGETKFAPGEWIGVELEEPVGKNDGSVGGISYFKCNAMHGVFSRATRLSRERKSSTCTTPVPETPADSRRKISSKLPMAVSPATSSRDLTKSRSVSPAGSVSSVASSAMGGPVKLGDRVIVSSQTAGTKTGTLRFLGPTDFAAGDWAGVELDAPIGKNDGCVGDKRYFECKPKFGLFAPLNKVTKSPSNRMNKLSATNAASPGRLCRQRSDLSDVSMTSNMSMRSTARPNETPQKTKRISSIVAPERLRTAVKEKEAKIEQLLKERDMERKVVAKAASQTDHAEKSLDVLRESYMAYKAQSTQQVLGLVNDINQLQDEKKGLKNGLEDEKRKSEDLQFQLEEAQLMHGETDSSDSKKDAESLNKTNELIDKLKKEEESSNKIKGLEEKLLEEETKHKLQKDIVAGLEKRIGDETAEKNQFKEQLDDVTLALESDRQKSKSENEKLQTLFNEIKTELEIKTREIGQHKEEFSNKVFEYEEQITNLSGELESNKTELKATKDTLSAEQKQVTNFTENLKNQNETFQEQITSLEGKLSNKEDEIITINHKLDVSEKSMHQLQGILDGKSEEVQVKAQEYHETTSQIARLNQEYSDQSQKLEFLQKKFETATSDTSKKDSLLQEIKSQVEQLEKTVVHKDKALEELKDDIEKNKADSDNVMKKKTEELSGISSKLSDAVSMADKCTKQKEESETRCNEFQKELDTIKKNFTDVNEVKDSLEREIEVLQQSSKKKIDEVKRLSGSISIKDTELETLRGDINSLSSQLQQLKSVISKGEDDLKETEGEMKMKFAKDIADLEEKLRKSEVAREKVEKSKEEVIKSLNTKIHDLSEDNTQSQQTLKSNVTKIESKYEAMQKEKENLQENSAVIQKENALVIENLKRCNKDLEKDLNDTKSNGMEKDKRINELLDNVEVIKKLEESLKNSQHEKESESEKKSGLEIQCKSLNDKVKDMEVDIQELTKTITDLRTSTSDSTAQLTSVTNEIMAKNNEIGSLKKDISDKKLEVSTLQAKLEDVRSKAEAKMAEEKEINSNNLSQYTKEKKELEDAIKENIVNYRNMKESLEKSLEDSKVELQTELSGALEEVTDRESELLTLKIELAKSQSDIDSSNREMKSAIKDKLEMEEQLESLKRTYTDEMGDLVDVVNDLKTKEEELAIALEQLDKKTSEFDKMKRDSARKEIDLQEEVKNERIKSSKEVEAITRKLNEAQSQIDFLTESNSSSKVEYDLKIEKIKKEKDVDLSNFHSELDNKDTIVEKLEEELEQIKAELEFKEEELAAKTEELEDLSTDLEVSTAGFNNSFKETNDTHKEEIEVLISKVETANSSIANLHETLARTTADHDTRIDELMSSHKSQMNNVQDRLSEKEQNILELNAKISDVEGKLSMTVSSMNDEAKVTETRIEKMLNENEDIRAKKGESDAMIRSLQTDYDSATHQNEVLYIKIVEKEEHIRQVTTQVESMKISFEKTQRELSERMDRTGQDTLAIEDLHKEIEVERSRVDEMQLAYAEIEGERDTLQEKYKDHDILKEQQAETEERESMLIRNVEDLKQKHEFAVEEFDAERSELNEVVQRSKKLVQDKLEEFKVQQFKFEQLQAENNQLNSYKRQVLLLEQEKRGWESSRPSASFMKEASPAKSIDDDAESLRSQVDFLNSVIVDMQRKNDDLKSKFDQLESAVGVLDDFGVDAQDMIMLNGLDKKKKPPRLFCDICDEFDLHDTEDCPTQAMPDIEEDDETQHTKTNATRGVVREYCDNCEMFGHSTGKCDEEQTF